MAPGVSNETFLTTCMETVQNPTIDFDIVAKKLGMSKGGAQNKFRAIVKPHTGGVQAAKTATRKVKSTKRKATPAIDDGDDASDKSTAATKKPRIGGKGRGKAIASTNTSDDSDTNKASPKKRAKATPKPAVKTKDGSSEEEDTKTDKGFVSAAEKDED